MSSINNIVSPLFNAVIFYITSKYGGRVHYHASMGKQFATINIKRPELANWQHTLRNPTRVFAVVHRNEHVIIDNKTFEYSDPDLFDHIDVLIDNIFIMESKWVYE